MQPSDTPVASEGYTVSVAAKVAGMQVRTAQRWAHSGLVHPSIEASTGRGYWSLFSFDDLVAFRTAAEMRRNGASMQAIRKALANLQSADPGATLANSALVFDGRDIFWRRGADVRSLLKNPGQQVFLWVIDLDAVQQEVRAALKAA